MKTLPASTNSTPTRIRKASGIREKTCHISVLMKSTSANTSSSGTAREITDSEAASCSNSRAPVQRTMANSP